MSFDNLPVVRGAFSMEDPWALPPSCNIIRLRRSADGGAPRLSTTLSAYYGDEYLNIIFSAADDRIVATLIGHDHPLYNEDVVEVFLAPDGLTDYFEIEVSPIGSTFDARIHSPQGNRETMTVDVAWDCDGLIIAVRKNVEAGGAMTVDTAMRIPFRSLGRPMPATGESWWGNFFRIDRHPTEGDEYSSWRPTLLDPPDFHVPRAFGRLTFE
jgi:hypothetical protein